MTIHSVHSTHGWIGVFLLGFFKNLKRNKSGIYEYSCTLPQDSGTYTRSYWNTSYCILRTVRYMLRSSWFFLVNYIYQGVLIKQDVGWRYTYFYCCSSNDNSQLFAFPILRGNICNCSQHFRNVADKCGLHKKKLHIWNCGPSKLDSDPFVFKFFA